MKRLHLLLLIQLQFASGAVVSVPFSGLEDFSLDIDSDGIAEFTDFGFWAEGAQMAFLFHVDGIDKATTFPDQPFAGYRGETFASKETLVSSSMFSGDLAIPLDYTRLYDNIQGVILINASTPVYAAWMYGSLGNGAEELRLLGMVVDATDFFSSGQTSNLKIFFHDYGSFAAGESITQASLSATGINTGASNQLDADVEFVGPKSGLIRVESKLGSTYRLKRGTTPNEGVTVATLIGTGSTLTLSWDDSESSDAAAFFWVEELTP